MTTGRVLGYCECAKANRKNFSEVDLYAFFSRLQVTSSQSMTKTRKISETTELKPTTMTQPQINTETIKAIPFPNKCTNTCGGIC